MAKHFKLKLRKKCRKRYSSFLLERARCEWMIRIQRGVSKSFYSIDFYYIILEVYIVDYLGI